jgi:hypothetical protein
MDCTLDAVRRCAEAPVNYVLSPAGLAAAEYLQQKFGTTYEVVSPLPGADRLCPAERAPGLEGPVLVVHQQFMANAVRTMVRTACRRADDVPEIDVATFFDFVPGYAEKGDSQLAGEDEFISLVQERNYRTIIADPLLARALPGFTGTFIPLPHFAVSGQLYAVKNEDEFLEPLYRRLGIR